MPLNIPSSIVPGDTVVWRDRSLRGKDPSTGIDTDYKPTDYALSWAIRGASAIDAIAVPDGNEFVTTIAASATAALIPGSYFWQAYVERASDRLTIAKGRLTVLTNLNINLPDYDGRTNPEKMLEAVEIALSSGVTKGIQSYTIKGRSLARYSIPELIQLRNQLRIEVSRAKAAESIEQGLGDPRRLYVRWR